MSNITLGEKFFETPWRRIRFKLANGYSNEGYVYSIVGDNYYVSQNQSPETMGFAQNWIIHKDEIETMNFEQWYNGYNPRFVPTTKQIAKDAWDACKQEVLEILKKDWTGLDMSVNSCDTHYIEKVEKL